MWWARAGHQRTISVLGAGFVGCVFVKNIFDLAALDHDALYPSASGFECFQTAFHVCLTKITRTLRHCLNAFSCPRRNHLLGIEKHAYPKIWKITRWDALRAAPQSQ